VDRWHTLIEQLVLEDDEIMTQEVVVVYNGQ